MINPGKREEFIFFLDFLVILIYLVSSQYGQRERQRERERERERDRDRERERQRQRETERDMQWR